MSIFHRTPAKVLALCLCVLLAAAAAGCAGTSSASGTGAGAFGADAPQFYTPSPQAPVAVFETQAGSFAAVLLGEAAPQAVQNFIMLAQQGAYDGLVFHRVIRDFIIQSGDTDGEGGQSVWGAPFPAEISDLAHHYTGALAMTGAGANRSQFFVVNTAADSVSQVMLDQMQELGWSQQVIDAYAAVGGAPYLDNTYTVFGQVFWGMETVRAIGESAPASGDTPAQPQQLQSVRVMTFAAWQAAHPDADTLLRDPAADAA